MENTIPFVNSVFNLISTACLMLGFLSIKKQNRSIHKRYMLVALISSALFLLSYLNYHYNYAQSVCIDEGIIRGVYLVILIPHIILAILVLPFIFYIVIKAFKEDFSRHKRLARYVFPVWLYVSITGIIIYLYVYQFFPESFEKKSLTEIIQKS